MSLDNPLFKTVVENQFKEQTSKNEESKRQRIEQINISHDEEVKLKDQDIEKLKGIPELQSQLEQEIQERRRLDEEHKRTLEELNASYRDSEKQNRIKFEEQKKVINQAHEDVKTEFQQFEQKMKSEIEKQNKSLTAKNRWRDAKTVLYLDKLNRERQESASKQLQTRIDSIDENLNQKLNVIENMKGSVLALKQEVAKKEEENNTKLGELTTQQQAQNTKLKEVTENLSKNSTEISGVKKSVSDLETQLASISNNNSSEQLVQNLTTQLEAHKKELADLAAEREKIYKESTESLHRQREEAIARREEEITRREQTEKESRKGLFTALQTESAEVKTLVLNSMKSNSDALLKEAKKSTESYKTALQDTQGNISNLLEQQKKDYETMIGDFQKERSENIIAQQAIEAERAKKYEENIRKLEEMLAGNPFSEEKIQEEIQKVQAEFMEQQRKDREAFVKEQDARIAEHKTQLAAFDTYMNELRAQQQTNVEAYNSANQKLQDLATKSDALLNQQTQLKQEQESVLASQIQLQEQQKTALASQLKQQQTALGSMQKQHGLLQLEHSNLQSKHNSMQGRHDVMQTNHEEIQEQAKQLNTKFGEQVELLAFMKEQVARQQELEDESNRRDGRMTTLICIDIEKFTDTNFKVLHMLELGYDSTLITKYNKDKFHFSCDASLLKDIDEYDYMHTFGKAGLHWREIIDEPASGLHWKYMYGMQFVEPGYKELENPMLANKIKQQKYNFTEEEWKEFGIPTLHMNHVVKVGDYSYYGPSKPIVSETSIVEESRSFLNESEISTIADTRDKLIRVRVKLPYYPKYHRIIKCGNRKFKSIKTWFDFIAAVDLFINIVINNNINLNSFLTQFKELVKTGGFIVDYTTCKSIKDYIDIVLVNSPYFLEDGKLCLRHGTQTFSIEYTVFHEEILNPALQKMGKPQSSENSDCIKIFKDSKYSHHISIVILYGALTSKEEKILKFYEDYISKTTKEWIQGKTLDNAKKMIYHFKKGCYYYTSESSISGNAYLNNKYSVEAINKMVLKNIIDLDDDERDFMQKYNIHLQSVDSKPVQQLFSQHMSRFGFRKNVIRKDDIYLYRFVLKL